MISFESVPFGMRNIFLILGFLATQVATGQITNTWQWTRDVQCNGTNTSNSFGITTDINHRVYVAGYFQGTITVGSNTYLSSGNNDFLLVKYNEAGQPLWSRTGGSLSIDNGNCVATDLSGNVYVAGFYSGVGIFGNDTLPNGGGYSEIFLIKYDSLGNQLWTRRMGGASNDYVEDIAVDGAGNIYLSGSFQLSATFGSLGASSVGLMDAFLVKYDQNGNAIWVRTSASNGLDMSYSVFCDHAGNVFQAGYFSNTADFSGQQLTSKGSYDVFLAKYDTAGTISFVKSIGGTGSDYGYSVAVDTSDQIYLSGALSSTVILGNDTLAFNGSNDCFLVKYDNAGNPLWAKSFGGTGVDNGYDIAITREQHPVLTGNFENNMLVSGVQLVSAGVRDIFLAMFDPQGNLDWIDRAGGIYTDQVFSLTADPNGAIYLNGNYNGQANFGSDTLNSINRTSLFISKLLGCQSIQVSPSQGFCTTSGTTPSLNFSVTSNDLSYTYQWLPIGVSGSSITVNPTTTTVYTVIATSPSGCHLSLTTTAIAETPASFTLTTSEDTVCSGQSVLLAADWHWTSPAPEPAGYCAPNTGINIADEQIFRFNFSTMTNSQVENCQSNYTDYTVSIPSIPVNRGGSYPFSIYIDECDGAPFFNSGISVFIDFNRDGDWDDAGEQAYTSNNLVLAPYVQSGFITVPNNASIGISRMRIVVQESTFSPGACTPMIYGEIEDYTIEIGTGGLLNSWSTGVQDSSSISTTPGSTVTYAVTSTSEYGCVATASATVTLIPSPSPTINGPSSACPNSNYTLDAGTGYSAYAWWENGQPGGSASTYSDSTSSFLSTQEYVVMVTAANGCTGRDTILVERTAVPDDAVVCLVTVDSSGSYNQIIWEKSVAPDAVDSFLVFREITSNTFQQIGAVDRNALSLFTDSSANVNATSYKYKITWRDTCGNSGNLSLYHNTIHLQYLGFGNLQWTNYEIENTATQVSSYNVYRDNISNGNFQLLQVVPGTNSTFTDVNYASYPNARYRVNVNWQTGVSCTPTARLSAVTTSLSNIRSISGTTGISILEDFPLSFFPNPAHQHVRLNSSHPAAVRLRMLDVSGRIVGMQPIEKNSMEIDLSGHVKGLYIIQLLNSDNVIVRSGRLIVE